jgi:serine phosphatase RsbU (regulator of sigma subunit)
VIETPGEHDRFGGDRLRRFLSDHASASPAELLDRLDAALDGFRSGPRQDDVVALALRLRPAS